jgi:hypothetical protein
MLKMKIVLVTLLVLPLVGCASNASKNVDDKIWQENGVGSRKDLQEESFRLIHDEPGLSPGQRDRLALLSSTMTQKLDVINLESVRLRSVLMKEVLAPDYKPNEVEVIKTRISGLEARRISTMFNGIEEANSILGRTPVENRRVLRAFITDGRTGID